ncbi:polymerase [Schistocephalus solidus toti-like virus 3]|nr:polymerase [Schistocephalus solidus toti-like virus 3]
MRALRPASLQSLRTTLGPKLSEASRPFADLASKNCHSWRGLVSEAKALRKRVARQHKHDETCEMAGDVEEWAASSSVAYTPPSVRPAPPFLACPSWARFIAFLKEMGQCRPANLITSLCSPSHCVKEVTEFLKLLSVYAKASAASVPEASWLVDLHRARGHLQPLTGSALEQAAEKWLCTPHEHTPALSYDWTLVCYVRGMDWLQNTFSGRSALQMNEFNDRFWNSRPWGTAGASDRYPYKIGVDSSGRMIKAPKTKNMLALYTSRGELDAKIFLPRPEIIVVGPKYDEFGKARHILRGDDATYLRHSYLDDVLYSKLTPCLESRRSPVTSSPNDWRQTLRYAGRGVDERSLNVLFDHSGFDEHQSIALVRSFMLGVISHAAQNVSDSPCQAVAAAAYASAVMPAVISSPTNPNIGAHLGGLPSGWRWTALLDTILNLSLTMSAWEVVQPGFSPRLALFMGDDSLVQVNPQHFGASMRVAGLINMLGYELSTLKNYASTETADFLGFTIMGERRITGAPSRMAVSITSRHNVPESPGSRLDVAFARIWTWCVFAIRSNRLGSVRPEWSMVVRDIWRATRLDALDVLSVMETSRSEGGLGIKDLSHLFAGVPLHVAKSVEVKPPDDASVPRLNPVRPLALAGLGSRDLSVIMGAFYSSLGVLKAPSSRPPAIAFRAAVKAHYHNHEFYPNGKLISVPPCRWEKSFPEAIATTVWLHATRKRSEFERVYSSWLTADSWEVYRWLRNRRHSWAVLRRWLCNRMPVTKRFNTRSDELDLLAPDSSTPDQARAFLSGDKLNTATWQRQLDRINLGHKEIYDHRGAFIRFFIKKDEWVGDMLTLKI